MTELKHRNMNGPNNPRNTDDSLIKITSFNGDGELQLIHGYDVTGFRITGTRYTGPVILLPRLTMAWTPPTNPFDVIDKDILPLISTTPPPLLIFGVGDAPQAPLTTLAVTLRKVGVNLELMSTPAACRTWNVLMSEGRNAAACLYLVN